MKVRYIILAIVLLLVALAVFTLSTFEMGGGGNNAYARAKAEQLRIYADVHSKRHDGKHVEDLADLTIYAEDGSRAIVDPWGNQFQFRYVIDPKTGKEKFVVWTVSPTNGEVLAAPREAAEWLRR